MNAYRVNLNLPSWTGTTISALSMKTVFVRCWATCTLEGSVNLTKQTRVAVPRWIIGSLKQSKQCATIEQSFIFGVNYTRYNNKDMFSKLNVYILLRKEVHFFNFTQESKQCFHLINCGILGDVCHLNNSCTGSLCSCSHVNWSILRRRINKKHSLLKAKVRGKTCQANLKGSVA